LSNFSVFQDAFPGLKPIPGLSRTSGHPVAYARNFKFSIMLAPNKGSEKILLKAHGCYDYLMMSKNGKILLNPI